MGSVRGREWGLITGRRSSALLMTLAGAAVRPFFWYRHVYNGFVQETYVILSAVGARGRA